MTDTTGSNTVATEGWDGNNVSAVSFVGKALVRERHEHDKTAVQTKLEELKAELHRGRRTETDDADRRPATTPTGSRTPPSSTGKKSADMTSTAPPEP
jgi:hypothetical protein